MKRFSYFSLIILVVISFVILSFSSKSTKQKKYELLKLDDNVVKISDSLFAGKYEVTNQEYLLYINFLRETNNLKALLVSLPDTLNWSNPSLYQEPMVTYYFRHPAYANYPLVNVSHEAAESYCNWLTEQYNLNPKRKFKKVIFRLPTESEWIGAAKSGVDFVMYPWGSKLLQNGQFMCNYRHIGDESLKFDSISNSIIVNQSSIYNIPSLDLDFNATAAVNSYKPNNFGLYNVCGNVAEMINQKGIACGGGWRSVGGDVSLQSRSKYQKSAIDLGFRYFMEILEK